MAPRTREELLSYGIIDPALEEVCFMNHDDNEQISGLCIGDQTQSDQGATAIRPILRPR